METVMIPGTPTSAKELAALLKLGEGKTLEFKRSTGELKDLDRKEILRTRELAIQQNRISPDTG